MRPPASTPAARVVLLGSLYLCQGLPSGFFAVALPYLLRRAGTSLEAIGWSGLLALPWVLKFLWAPAVDQWGSRRAWIVTLQLLTVGFLSTVALRDLRDDVTLLCVAVAITNLLAATQDVATDGYAVDLLGDDERGLGNGVQVAGYRAGMILGGGALLVALDRIGWTASFACMAAVVAAASVPVAWFGEPARTPAPSGPRGSLLFRGFFGRPGVVGWILVIGTYKLGEAVGSAMVRPWLADLGYSLDEVGWLLGTGGFFASLVGALSGGALVQRLGRRPALVAFGLFQSLAVLAFVAVAAADGAGMGRVVLAEHFLSGMATAAVFTAMMDASRPSHGATDYTLQASVIVVAQGVGGILAGYLAGAGGYGLAALVGGVLSAAGALAMTRAPLLRPPPPASLPVGRPPR